VILTALLKSIRLIEAWSDAIVHLEDVATLRHPSTRRTNAMTDTTLTRGAGNPLFTLARNLAERRRNAVRRRTVKRLLDLDDRILHDIGVTRGEARHAAGQPLTVDPLAELYRTSLSRRARERSQRG
jgi:uncharacterized protein YjiS (DUF1127 family)